MQSLDSFLPIIQKTTVLMDMAAELIHVANSINKEMIDVNEKLKVDADSSKNESILLNEARSFENVYLNCTEVQRLLGVSAPVIASWVKCGLLPERKLNKKTTNRYLLSDIEWINRRQYKRLSMQNIRDLIIEKNKGL